jgi:hypothetical protein
MGTIHKYIPKELLFDPDTLSAMGDAYDRALRAFPTPPAQSVREVIATQIIFLARAGLRDPVQLCQEALAAYGLQSECA